ncbi:D-alanine--poly(phosphoribitol) ligase, subunit 1 [Mycobacteroides abscessus subsp. abscessus]|nr:D-alanine--poly(phosphoribitol) ligase, subunit 1 [Mycobacteroides abscessus subsp. abscessus]
MGWRYVDLSAEWNCADKDEELQRLCAAERAAVCDLTEPPAFRVALIRVAAERYRFVLTNHHIVLDGWSLPILLQEIFAASRAASRCGPYCRRPPSTSGGAILRSVRTACTAHSGRTDGGLALCRPERRMELRR